MEIGGLYVNRKCKLIVLCLGKTPYGYGVIVLKEELNYNLAKVSSYQKIKVWDIINITNNSNYTRYTAPKPFSRSYHQGKTSMLLKFDRQRLIEYRDYNGNWWHRDVIKSPQMISIYLSEAIKSCDHNYRWSEAITF